MVPLGALLHLHEALRSKPELEKITTEESKVIQNCAVDVLNAVATPTLSAEVFFWQAARRLEIYQRIAVTVGSYLQYKKIQNNYGFFLSCCKPSAATSMVLYGAAEWACNKTAISCIERILRQDATRMQKELVNILIRDYEGEAWRLNLISKHFYSESVYNDDKADKPQMRWRRRNIFTDAIFSSHDIDETELYSSYGDSSGTPRRSIPHHAVVTRAKPLVQCDSGNPYGDLGEDPFDCIFGSLETSEDVNDQLNSAGSSRVLTRKQRRAQRRHKIRYQEASLGTPLYERT